MVLEESQRLTVIHMFHYNVNFAIQTDKRSVERVLQKNVSKLEPFSCNPESNPSGPAMRKNVHSNLYIRRVTVSQNSKMAEASGGEGGSSSNVADSDDKIGESVSAESQKEKPTCVLCLGMAGSGKTTFVQVFSNRFHGQHDLTTEKVKTVFDNLHVQGLKLSVSDFSFTNHCKEESVCFLI